MAELIMTSLENDVVAAEPTARERWRNRGSYLLALLGYMVGLGAIWRFPYLCYRWGGVLFLIPYFLGMTLVGIPMATMEVLLGQIH